MLRIHDTVSDLLAHTEASGLQAPKDPRIVEVVNRVEAQARLLITALNTVYLALGSFSGATLVTLVGVALFPLLGTRWYTCLAFLGVALGTIGVVCLIISSLRLFQATQLSLVSIREEANRIRSRH